MKYFFNNSVMFTFRSSTTRLLACTLQTLLFALCILWIGLATSTSAAELVSVNRDGTDSANDASGSKAISADGRFVAFASEASDLVATDTNGARDIFVRDLQAGTTTLISVNRTGTNSANSWSSLPEISADGRIVVFVSAATDLVATDNNGNSDIFIRDLQAGTTALVTVNNAGTDSGNASFDEDYFVISGDGRFVAFTSSASDLVATDTNENGDVFVRDLQVGTTTLISVNNVGDNSGNGDSSEGVIDINFDGHFVAFNSFASDLVETDTNDGGDIFVRDLQSGTTTLVSVNNAGIDSANSNSRFPAISADGRFVAFASSANDLVATDTNNREDVFVRDLQAGTTTLVSTNNSGIDSANDRSTFPVFSADGRFVAFNSFASDLVATDNNGEPDVFVRDLQAGITTLVSVNRTGTDSAIGFTFRSDISADGRFVAFISDASDLVATDTNNRGDVFVRDLQAGTTTLISTNRAGNDSGNGESREPVFSADGRFVAFNSFASDLVATDTNNRRDVFVFEIPTPKACDCDDSAAITGSPGADYLVGTSGDDIICGFGGKDRIYGGKGNDCIDGGDGMDKIYGGKGDDTIDGGDGMDKIYGGRGHDLIFGQQGNDKIYGDHGDDTIEGGDGNDKIKGGKGHDLISGQQGKDKIYGDKGDDTIDGGQGKDRIFGNRGDDTIDGGEGFDKIYGGRGKDECVNGEFVVGCEP